MTSPFTDCRTGIVDELSAMFPTRKVYAWVPPSPVLPCITVAPDNTDPVEIAGHGRWNYHLRITAMASAQTATATTVANLEQDMTDLLGWAGPLAQDIAIGPGKFGDATVYAVSLTITQPVEIPNP
jgi:hypothetical protein